MKIALITPYVVDQPSIGHTLRLYQLQVILERIVPGNVVIWELDRQAPASCALPVATDPTGEELYTGPTLGGLWVLRTLLILALHRWPSFTVRSLGEQYDQILAWITEERPTHAILAHPDGTELVGALKRQGIKVFIDAHNVESDLARQLIALVPAGRQRLAALERHRAIGRWERRYFPLADEVWLPSAVDAARQQHICGEATRIRVVPNALDITRYTPRNGEGTHDIVLPGSFGYPPNVAGARMLRDRVIQAVRRVIPDARLILVGRDPGRSARALQHLPEVIVTGAVPNTLEFFCRAGVVAVPILQAGGTRYKILEALAFGVPVVTTPLGCEGLAVRDGEHLLIRDIEDFAAAITEILTDPGAFQELGRQGRRLVETNYTLEVVEAVIRRALCTVQERVPE